MLKIENISKTYKTGSLVQVALDNVSLNLRDNEFVAILGPSGSGKTTLLNIIGGLDHYDSGDLQINSISTKNYKDKDWDAYRNHTIGFVFQSYNLIPHQTILANVELALTIGGVSKKERKERALKALEEVGLKEQAHKKPNQLSGGQMQRVAIARALVNNPDILLADEPTGALDSKTSIQVMELLKNVASKKLVVMVTHNPELADAYANRIVRLQDGKIIDDTNPYIIDKKTDKPIRKKRIGKARMNFLTALSLSFNNLLTKKGRTILTAFAGSIGIIGIALILSLSQGFQNYIDKIQEDTLSSYPLTVTSETADATTAILSMVSDKEKADSTQGDVVVERRYLTSMFSAIGTNDLKSFKNYLDNHSDDYKDDVSQIRYSYSVTPYIYTIDAANNLAKLNPSNLMSTFYSDNAVSMFSSFSSSSIFSEMVDDREALENNYDVLKGKWPEKYDEMVLILSEKNSISDLLVYSLGLKDTNKLRTMISDIMAGKEVIEDEALTFTYDDLLNLEFKLINGFDFYKYNSDYNIYEDMSNDKEYMMNVYNNSLSLKIVGIVIPKENSSALVAPGVAYTKELTEYVINEASKSEIVKKQLSNPDVDVVSNKSFDIVNSEEENNTINFEDMISVDEKLISEAFTINIDQDSFSTNDTANSVLDKSQEIAKSIEEMTSEAIITTNLAYKEAIIQLIDGYNSLFTYSIPSGCEFYKDKNNPLKGCALVNPDDETQRVKNEDDYILVKGLDISNLEDPIIDIYIPKNDETTSYTIYHDLLVKAYKSLTMNVDTLQDETLVEVATKAFDEYVSQIKASKDYNEKTYSIDISKIEISLEKIVEKELTDKNVQNAIFKNTTKLMEEYTYLLIAKGIGEALEDTMAPFTDMFNGDLMKIDSDKFAKAFKFDMSQEELSRVMESMFTKTEDKTAKGNLISFGYQDINDPTTISFYFKNFEAKENFLAFIDHYNEIQTSEEKEIKYTDITGLLMSSVKTIVDSVSYVLIAFVSISLVVSSIMIAVITLISVMERTKEIGILRAMGASKKNVSSIFNAETFIIGLLSGVIGIGTSLILIVPINNLIHHLTDNYDINAVLPNKAAIILIIISVVLTIFAGIIPSKKASKQDPVIALRTE